MLHAGRASLRKASHPLARTRIDGVAVSAAIRGVAVVLLLLCAAWLAQACAAPVEVGRDVAANCEAWDDMRRGVVACERPGDKCAYGEGFEKQSVGSADAHWLCTCGADVQIYWCEAVAP